MWQLSSGSAVETLGNYQIKLPDSGYGSQLVYPDEDISSGIRIEYTSLIEPFVAETFEDVTATASGTGIEFVDNGVSADRINDSNNGLGDFEVGDKLRVIGSASNDGDYTVTIDGGVGSLSVATGSLIAEDSGELITIYQIPKEVTSPSESTHVNLNRMLCLAVVCYVMAQLTDDPKKEDYYMKLFWRKVGDNESNKKLVSTVMTSTPYAIR
tara:strand:+ start:77 stop:712 length:636 start_codon:yes stop_codon:yes gene_type:complete